MGGWGQFCQDIYRTCPTIEEEVGVDVGAIKKHIISTLLDLFESGIENTENHYNNLMTSDDEENNYMSPDYLRNRLFCFGVFSGSLMHSLMFFGGKRFNEFCS